MNILTIHASHDGAITISSNNDLIVHSQIDRFSKFKRYPIPSFEIIQKINELNIKFNKIIITHLDDHCVDQWLNIIEIKKLLPTENNFILSFNNQTHHLHHAYCLSYFYNSEIEDIFVSDQNGSTHNIEGYYGSETFSFVNNKQKKFTYYYTDIPIKIDKYNFSFSPLNYGVGLAYHRMAREFGLNTHDENKLMAYSTIKQPNDRLENEILYKNNFNLNIFKNEFRKNENFNYTNKFIENASIHPDNTLGMAFVATFQKICERKILEQILKHSGGKTIGFTGGVAQNILINSYLSKALQKQFFVDPFCSDQGISLGAMYEATNFNLNKTNTLYLGFDPKYELDIFNKFIVKDSDVNEVSQILKLEPVAIFQGRSEQGQRGLGNRSLLMNATFENSLDILKKVKNREWYRPFACSILEEELDNYFIKDASKSPYYMLYVYEALQSKKEILKNVLAPNNTCRLQAVNYINNKNYYLLLKQFFEMTKIPFLINTSLNLSGYPLVENLHDLKFMMEKSNLKYAWLPEISKLIIKP